MTKESMGKMQKGQNQAYRDAGVDLGAGYRAVELIKQHVARTSNSNVLSQIGSFGGLWRFTSGDYEDPVLVSSTDGVGTKLKIAFALDKHDTVGIDLVAMCVNDIVVQGARPLFFLDYLASSRIEPAKVEQIVQGIADGCEQAGCALLGGETAEMPGFYQEGEYDLAGFAVGAVDRQRIVDGSEIRPGDVIIGIGSSGLHSNGFSLVRKLLADNGLELTETFPEERAITIGELLLTPTRIYADLVGDLLGRFSVKGMAHITGGGIIENVPRILPQGCAAEIDCDSWSRPKVFNYLAALGNISSYDMFNTFNMGLGLILVVSPETVGPLRGYLQTIDEPAYVVGSIIEGQPGVVWRGGME